MNCKLAIVIPAYKALYFDEALQSISNQSCKDFTLYIGDDASPYNLKTIVDRFTGKININYHRFAGNIGKINLSKQWERCIELTRNEDFIWLFSDDDVMPANGVELFYKTIEINNGFDLYRFNIRQIDSNGSFISDSTKHPEIESAENFIYRRLKGETISSACEYIFSKKAIQNSKAFVQFPLAWGSDDASWFLLGKKKGIYTIKGDFVYWRISNENISAPGGNLFEKYNATILFLSWIKQQNISKRVKDIIPYSIKRQSIILKVNLIMFLNHLFDVYRLLGFRKTLEMSLFMMKIAVKSFLEYGREKKVLS